MLDLYLFDLESKQLQQLTNDPFADLDPEWTPDGRELVWVTDRFSSDLESLSFGNYRIAAMIALRARSGTLAQGAAGRLRERAQHQPRVRRRRHAVFPGDAGRHPQRLSPAAIRRGRRRRRSHQRRLGCQRHHAADAGVVGRLERDALRVHRVRERSLQHLRERHDATGTVGALATDTSNAAVLPPCEPEARHGGHAARERHRRVAAAARL